MPISGPTKSTRSTGAMAKRRKTSSTTKKKTGYRTSLLANPIDFGRYSLPLRAKNVMRYAATTDITMLGSGEQVIAYRANGMFDPEVALGGHQPLYFDQLSAIYNHWHVVASKIKIRIVPLFGAVGSLNATMLIDDDTTLSSTATTSRERPGAVSWITSAAQDDVGRTIYWNAQKTFGGNIIDNDDLKGTAAADPTEESIFWLYLSGGTLDNPWRVYADIEYTVVWSELKSMSAS